MSPCLRGFLIAALFFSGILSAQQTVTVAAVSPEFVKVNQAYANATNLQMKINYSLYADHTTPVKEQSEDGIFMKQDKNTYSELFGITSLCNSKANITVDKSEKVIVVADPSRKKSKAPGEVDMDSLLTICSSIRTEEKENGIKIYRMRFDNAPYTQYEAVDVYINPKTFFFEKIVLYFREETSYDASGKKVETKPRLEISYSSIEVNPVFEKDQFSESRFIVPSGKKFTCAPAFASYHLINNKLQ